MFSANEKVAIITGGARGIGFAIAKELLRNNAKGVAILDVDATTGRKAVNELWNEFGKKRAIFVKTDVSERSQFEAAFEETIVTFNRLDIVINNAGLIEELQWEKCIDINLKGCVTGSLLALDKYFPQTLGSSEGIILNVSSVLGLIEAEFEPVYSATKFGVIGFSKSLSGPNRCRKLNVRVLTICPGGTSTSLSEKITEKMASDMCAVRSEAFKNILVQSPEQLAQNVMGILAKGRTGSVWIINDNTSEEVNFPVLFKL